MIEIENMQSTVTDHTLRMVLSLCGQECKDKLLYEGEPAYGFHQLPERSSAGGTETRLEPDDNRHSFNGAIEGQRDTQNHPTPLAEALPVRR